MSAVAEGWTVDPADPSAGIFGTCYYHEDCPNWPKDDNAEPAEETGRLVATIGQGVGRFATYEVTLHCQRCGAGVSWTERDWDPDYDELEAEN